MQLIVLFVSLLATLVVAQPSVGELPSCAIGCVTGGIEATGCQLTNVTCFCTATAFLQTIAPCVYQNCSVADQNLTQTIADGICLAGNPPVTLPSFASLLNETNTPTSSPVPSGTVAASSASGAVSASASASGGGAAISPSAAATSKSSAAGPIEGDMRIITAVTAMVGLIAIAFVAV